MKVLFVCSGNSQFGIIPFVKSQGESVKKEGVNLDYFKIKGKGFYGYFKNIKLLKHHLRINKYDLIHAHYGLCGWVSLLTLTKTPIVVSFMGDDLYGDANLQGKKNLIDYPITFFNKILQFFIDYSIVKSSNLAKHILRKKRLSIIPNGVNFKLFKPLDKLDLMKKLNLDLSPGKKYLLFLGDEKIPRIF